MNKTKNTQKGFTLIELLVVVAIIGVLATVVLASLSSARTKAKESRYKQEMRNMQKVLEIYRLDNDTYPIVASWQGVSVQFGSRSVSGSNAYIPGLVPDYISELPAVSGSIGSGGGYLYVGGVDGYSFLFYRPALFSISTPAPGQAFFDSSRSSGPNSAWKVCSEDVPNTWCNR
jgi:type II secretion system protein G